VSTLSLLFAVPSNATELASLKVSNAVLVILEAVLHHLVLLDHYGNLRIRIHERIAYTANLVGEVQDSGQHKGGQDWLRKLKQLCYAPIPYLH
jgi:hypothetical protein